MTKGFADLLEIGDQTRPDLFDLSISSKPTLLYSRDDVIEASERVTPEGWTLDPEGQTVAELLSQAKEKEEEGEVFVGVSGEVVRVLEKLGRQSQVIDGLGFQLNVCIRAGDDSEGLASHV